MERPEPDGLEYRFRRLKLAPWIWAPVKSMPVSVVLLNSEPFRFAWLNLAPDRLDVRKLAETQFA